MASSSSLFQSFVLLLLFSLLLQIEVSMAGGEGSVNPKDCPWACNYRCSKTEHRKPCLTYCNECCLKCHCVPSGTYGRKEECPCYDQWKTKRGSPKCP